MIARERDLLNALLDATPEAPGADADPTDVTEASRLMLEARAPLLHAIHTFLSSAGRLSTDCDPLIAQLREREARWMAAMQRARRVTAERLVTLHRMRPR